MSLFLITIFVLYSSLHLYLFMKMKAAFAFKTGSSILIVFLMAVMISSPVLVRLLEKQEFELLARVTAYVGYTWMGLTFLFFSFSLIVDLYHLSVYVGDLVFRRSLSSLVLSSQSAFGIPLLITVAIAFYGYFEARQIRNDTVVIESLKIPKEVGTLTIVQISDVHAGLIVRHERLKRIIRTVEKAKPDLVVSTGDLVDGQIDNLRGLSDLLRTISPRYGKFAVTGNHEFYAGLSQALGFTEEAGFEILRGESRGIAGIINIAGVDDPTGWYFGLGEGVSERALLSELPPDKYTLLLKHRPVVDGEALGLFDLQLSGHTHKGQIFPFTFITRIFFPFEAGLVRLRDKAYLYTSRGSGTWGPPIRFMSPPEVTVIKLVHREG
ncbi:MAG: metallophosphoesterase [Proteobacteria bacterium]|nr:metallophosphoesterase [Pseudomonadota bacterium]